MVKLVHTVIIITVVLSFSIIQNYLLFVWGWINKSRDALLRFYRDRHTSYIDKL